MTIKHNQIKVTKHAFNRLYQHRVILSINCPETMIKDIIWKQIKELQETITYDKSRIYYRSNKMEFVFKPDGKLITYVLF